LNIGAHLKGQSSLDYRVRDASHIKNRILGLLNDLESTICEGIDFLSANERTPQDQALKPGRLKDLSESNHDSRPQLLGNTVFGHPESSKDDISELEPEIVQIYHEIVNIIDGLYRMSMLIRRPAPHDRVFELKTDDAAAYAHFDRAHVAEKFPNADAALIERLGMAITRRRSGLVYRKRHHQKLSQGLDDYLQADRQSQQTVDALSETMATDLVVSPVDQPENSYASSEVSETSYAASLFDSDSLTVPNPPLESANQQPFQCPFCFFIIAIRDRRAWARHVFQDLLPYVCVFHDCVNSHKMYASRHEWFTHEISSHLVPKVHPGTTWSDFLPNASKLPELKCPVCHQSSIPGSKVEKHIARHLEDLALFALPKSAWDNDQNDQEENEDNDGKISSDATEDKSNSINRYEDPEPEQDKNLENLKIYEKQKGEDGPEKSYKAELQQVMEQLDKAKAESTRTAGEAIKKRGEDWQRQEKGKVEEEAQSRYDAAIAEIEIEKVGELLEDTKAEEQREERRTKALNLAVGRRDIKEAQEKFDAELEIKIAKEQLEKAAGEEERKEIAKIAVEDWQREEEAKKLKIKEEEELDNKLDEELNVKSTRMNSFSAEVERVLTKDQDDDKKDTNGLQIIGLRPTFIKVHVKYLLPETLDVYQLPWAYDSVSYLFGENAARSDSSYREIVITLSSSNTLMTTFNKSSLITQGRSRLGTFLLSM
jgi:hypothetical protein